MQALVFMSAVLAAMRQNYAIMDAKTMHARPAVLLFSPGISDVKGTYCKGKKGQQAAP